MKFIERPASEFKSICAALGYRRKKVNICVTESVTLHDLNWSGGTRNQYSAVDLYSNEVATPNLGIPHPMFNENEGARIAMRPNVAIIQHGVFMGKPAKMTIYIHPENMPALIGD